MKELTDDLIFREIAVHYSDLCASEKVHDAVGKMVKTISRWTARIAVQTDRFCDQINALSLYSLMIVFITLYDVLR